MTHKKKVRLAVVALSAVAAQFLAGCVGTPAREYEQRVNAECPITPAEASGRLRIGYQISLGTELYIRDRGLAEVCLPNVEVQWIRFPSGQDVVKSFAADSIDLGVMGSTPAAKSISPPLNLDVVVPRVDDILGTFEGLVVKDEQVQSVADLKGKRIATPYGSTPHYSLLNALRDVNLDPAHDVELVNLSPDALPAAWQSARIDAAYVWDPVLSELTKSGHVLLTNADVAEAGAPTFTFLTGSRAWIEANPEVMETWLSLQDWAYEQWTKDPEDFEQGNANQAHISIWEAKKQLAGLTMVAPEDQPEQLETVVEALIDTSAFLAGEKQVSAPVDGETAKHAVIPRDAHRKALEGATS